MIRTFTFQLAALFVSQLFAQAPPDADSERAYARVPKIIAFQNDSQWEDNRLQQSDVGPFLSSTISMPKGPTLKGIAIRVGDQRQATVCFDTARLRFSAGWTGDFLQFMPRRFGLVQFPKVTGEPFFTTPKKAGWAKYGRFDPEPEEITQPDVAEGYVAVDKTETRLPKDWAYYRGLYTSGNRVVLSYSVGPTDVLESPWYVQAGDDHAFVRSLEIGPSPLPMQMWVADSKVRVSIIAGADADSIEMESERPVLSIAPHENTVRLKLLITKKDVSTASADLLRRIAGSPENLSELIKDDTGRYRDVLTTRGETTESPGPYVVDTITMPFENPYKSLLFASGHDFFSDGSAAVCMVHGDVWTVSGIDRNLGDLRWRRYATGLFQPLGLRIVDDKVYVIGRDQITRLHDRNGDGEADYYENFTNEIFVSPRAHDFVTCLDTDAEGNFYFIHGKTGVMKVTADGETITTVADGFRNPNGMGVSPQGMITAAPQQGTWTPESSLIVVKPGGYYGYGGPRVSSDRPTGWDLPMCFIPRAMDNSGGGQVWVEGDRWGLPSGLMLHLSYGQCRALLALTEKVGDETYQGGTITFPMSPSDFESGSMRGRFSPHDGQLYVTGMRGWQTNAIRDGCFQRVRYTGEAVNLPVGVKTFTNGIKLTFSEPLDPQTAGYADNFFVTQWNYLYSAEYGSPEFSVTRPQEQGRDEVAIVSATLMDENYAVFLEMPGRTPVHQLNIDYSLRSFEGVSFRGRYAHTINVAPSDTVPESDIVRRNRPPLVSPEIVARLTPAAVIQFRSERNVDARTTRLVALHQTIEHPPTPFLDSGPFTSEIAGTIKIPLSGFYDFRLKNTGHARLWINDDLILDSTESGETSSPIALRKGHNRIRVDYESPPKGVASVSLHWKGYNFSWEPVPPDALFHDPETALLERAKQRRLGRSLFAEHQCAHCHQTEIDSNSMLELTLEPPRLTDAGSRWNAAWLAEWMTSPQSLRPGTPMPAVLGSGESARQAARDIAAFLVQGENMSASATGTDDSKIDGESVYETLGCIACHHFGPPDEADEFGRLSLHHASAKFRHDALAAFLLAPDAYHKATRMPNFKLTEVEASALARFIRDESKGDLPKQNPPGNAARGKSLFGSAGCQSCHQVGEDLPAQRRQLAWKSPIEARGCLSSTDQNTFQLGGAPSFDLSADERTALLAFITDDLPSLQRSSKVETSARLSERLRCASCHDRDGQRSHRQLVIASEGSGRLPDVLPALTWAGEKFQPSWSHALLRGELDYKSRPWIAARMPAFPRYARSLSRGLAAEHGIDPDESTTQALDPEMVRIGERLTLETGLDCRQCHAIGDLQPRGDEKTLIARGINFQFIKPRLRRPAYHRFMLDPPRYDANTKMIRLSTNGLTTKLKTVFDQDAKKQFEAVWQYIQSLPEE